jgi:putative transcriptional regulator
MTIKHHIGDDLVLAYASGELDEATSLLVATHMALCPQCRQALELAESIGGTLIEEEAEAEIADGELEAILGRIEYTEDSATPAPVPAPAPERARRGSYVLPQPLRDYADGDVDGLRWRSLGGGVRHLPINTGASRAKARLLYIPAGSKVPDHGHRGLELTLVLAGSFYDEGAWFRRGDVEEADATVEHQPVAGPEEACICLAVTDAPLRFRSLIPRLAQPFLGI